ncbi:MAG: HPr family phosphocarrier protein [Lachnospiraceae bacterium]|nr:HPr family phosphocarrier protein [Lachnospiraceae bacterium]
MKKKSVKIQIAEGTDARPIAMLVQVATKFESQVYVQSGDKRVNAKSIMGMMSLVLKTGEEILVSADGVDEEEAVAGVEEYLTAN